MNGASSHSVGQREPITEEEMTRDRRFKLVKHFHKLNPPVYTGIEGSEAAEEFLNRAEKIFELLECSSQERVVLATYSLKREANAWWRASKESVEMKYVGDAWEQFRQAFLYKYFPFTVREDKAQEFDQQTEEMSVDQYEAKFSELSRYAPEMVNTPEKMARKFKRGLLPRIKNLLAALMLTSYGELYRRAQKIEKTLLECMERDDGKRKRLVDEGSSRFTSKSAKRGRFIRSGATSGIPRYSGYAQSSEMMSPSMCRRCEKWHAGWRCPEMSGNVVHCYRCGRPGHIQRHCPQNQGPVSTRISGVPRGRGGAMSGRLQSFRGSVSRMQEHKEE